MSAHHPPGEHDSGNHRLRKERELILGASRALSTVCQASAADRCYGRGGERHTRTVSHGRGELRFYGDVRGNCGPSRRIQGGIRFGSVWPLHVTAWVTTRYLLTRGLIHGHVRRGVCTRTTTIQVNTQANLHLVLGGHARATFTSQPIQLWEPARIRLSLNATALHLYFSVATARAFWGCVSI